MNTFQYQQLWLKEYQKSNWIEPVHPVIADMQMLEGLKISDTVHRRYRNAYIVAKPLGSDGSYSPQAYTEGDEYFSITRQKEASVRINKPEVLHKDQDYAASYGRQLADALWMDIEGHVLYTASTNAGATIDAGYFGGSAGDGITVSITNIASIPIVANEIFLGKSVKRKSNMRFGKLSYEEYEGLNTWIVPPQVWTQINLYMVARNTSAGDAVTANGYKGNFGEFEIFVANTLTFTTRLELGSTNPTDGDTMTFFAGSQAVTFRFKNTLGQNGDIKIGATAAETCDNIVAALNALTTTTANYDAWEDTDTITEEDGIVVKKADKMQGRGGIVATDGSTYVDIAIKGSGKVTVSETFTSPNNVFTAARQVVHAPFVIGKNIALAMRKDPEIYENPVSGKVAKDYVMWTVYDAHVFRDQKRAIIDTLVRCDASSFASYTVVRA